MSKKPEPWNISYKQLGIIIISFTLGFVVAFLASNSQSASTTNFSTTELIGFVLSVILSGASIVLAISAIALSKSSEQAVIQRSDDSIRLQTEVYTKTTDALQSIKASTDVTEKRIEDIISGRAGDISMQIAEIARNETAGNFDINQFEEKIKKSIVKTLEHNDSDEAKKQREERREVYNRRKKEYLEHHDLLLYSIANKNNTKILKIGHGEPHSDGTVEFGRYDAVFERNDDRIAVSTMQPREKYSLYNNLTDIMVNLTEPMESENISKLYLILFGQSEDDKGFKTAINSLSILKDEIASKINISAVQYHEVDGWADSKEL